ncbi:hypothetical protein [Pseudaquidulcibacter saccharophilus]|uniref:hypothetical protein n=1 Tax=Pseudaquidulcibacter saccharophilus TaxID=2831900 RepID=UPI001EFEF555|nr:hypothetical protein [Pseudaquidulcibacter saccharophilus]
MITKIAIPIPVRWIICFFLFMTIISKNEYHISLQSLDFTALIFKCLLLIWIIPKTNGNEIRLLKENGYPTKFAFSLLISGLLWFLQGIILMSVILNHIAGR